MHINELYKAVTASIVADLERGVKPWQKPWDADEPFPANYSTGQRYRGINILILWAQSQRVGFTSTQWLTYRQAAALGGQVRKGEHGTHCVFYKPVSVETVGEEDETEPKVRVVAREFVVFNLDQIDGIAKPQAERVDWNAHDAAEEVLSGSGAKIRHGGTRAYYRSAEDRIQLPGRARFTNADDYYATALHELVHWTGHESRLARKLGNRFGSDAYAMEELIAEIGSAFLTTYLGITGEVQHASYIDSWLTVLKRDTKAVFSAAAQAEKAFAFLTESETASTEAEAA
ncbi:MAG: DUF1738 domain-containing protein [Chromatiales bacterium]|nr:DUF1738 domain-containing protein [Chromatiales bacterium]